MRSPYRNANEKELIEVLNLNREDIENLFRLVKSAKANLLRLRAIRDFEKRKDEVDKLNSSFLRSFNSLCNRFLCHHAVSCEHCGGSNVKSDCPWKLDIAKIEAKKQE